MTNKELIELLKQYPDDAKVEFSYFDGKDYIEFLDLNLNYLDASNVLDFEIR